MLKAISSRLQYRLLIFIIALTLIPAVATLIFTVTVTNTLVFNASAEQETTTVEVQAVEVEIYLDGIENELRFLSEATVVQSYVDAVAANDSVAAEVARGQINDLFRAFAGNLEKFDQVHLLDADGIEVVRVNLVDGEAVEVPPEDLQDKANRPYFVETVVLEAGDLYISPLNLNVERGAIEQPFKPVVRYATPIFAANGELGGAVVLNVLAQPFLELARPNDANELIYFMDADGTYFVAPNEELLFGRDFENDISFFTTNPQDASEVFSGESAGVFTSIENPDQVVTFARVQPPGASGAIDWLIVHQQPVANLLAPVTAQQIATIIIATVSVLVAAALGILVSRGIVVPIQRLADVTAAIGRGQWDTPVPPVRSRDEIGQLTAAVQDMTSDVRQAYATLEQRVSERTRDLQSVAEVNRQISTILEPDRLLQDMVDLTKEQFRLYHAHVYLLNEFGDTLTLTSGAGHVGRQMVSEQRVIAIENPLSIVANAARTQQSVVINNVATSTTFLPHPLLPDTRSELATPLIARGRVLGVLDVQSDEENFFTVEILSVLELMAGQIATALNNAQLYEVAARTGRHERALGNIDRQMQEAIDADELLQIAVRELGKALRVPHTAIELHLPEGAEPQATEVTGNGSKTETREMVASTDTQHKLERET